MSSVRPPAATQQPGDYVLRVERRGFQKLTYWLRTPFGKLSMVALIAVILLAWQAPTIYRAAKVWRVERLIAESREAQQAGDDTTATRLLQEAFNLLPAHALTLRARAHHYERRGEANALLTYHKLLGRPGATAEDAIRASRLAVLKGSPDICEKILELAEKITRAGEPAAVLALRARTKAATDQWSEAITLAEKAVESSDCEAPEKLLLAKTLIEAADRVAEDERLPMAERAVALLADLATSPNETAINAFGVLIGIARQPVAARLFSEYDVTLWIDAAERHPKASARLRVLAWNLLLVSKRGEAEQVFAAFLEKWREAPLPERLEAARWLNQNGRPRLCLGLSFLAKETSEDWFLVHLDALAAEKQWTALLEHLDAESGQVTTMSKPLRTLYRLVARGELGERVNAEESWREIQQQLQSEPARTQLSFAQYAEKIGEIKQAALIYQRVLDISSTTAALARNLKREVTFACYTGLLRTLPVSAPIGDVLPIAESFAAEFPEIEETRHEAIYLRVLAGRMDEQIHADLATLLQNSPSAPLLRATAALLELKSGNAAAADKIFEEVKVAWDSAPDRLKAVRVAVLKSVGGLEEARQIRSKIRERNLRPEELAMLP